MAHEIDRLGELLRDASLSATILLSLVALAMIACRQPVRRICLGAGGDRERAAPRPFDDFRPPTTGLAGSDREAIRFALSSHLCHSATSPLGSAGCHRRRRTDSDTHTGLDHTPPLPIRFGFW